MFTATDAEKALPKGSAGARTAWVKMANSALKRGMSEDAASSAATKMAGTMKEAAAVHRDLLEVGRVLSGANEKALRAAADAISAVLSALGKGEEPAAESAALIEAYSQSASDAARGVGVAASLQYAAQSVLDLVSTECDEPDQVKTLQAVYDAIQAAVTPLMSWIRTEMAEVDTGDDTAAAGGGMAEAERSARNVEAGAGDPLVGDIVPLLESVVRRDGTVPLRIIAPGWGSSGYYSPALLERDGPKVFVKGLKSYWDHPTVSEATERPERSLRDLAAELVSDARYDASGAAGAGLYADAKVFGPYREAVNELAPHIGVSIRAMGQGAIGEAEGRKGRVIEKLIAAQSVDFVTTPGAGGQVVSLFEAARSHAITPTQEDTSMDELKEAQTKLAEAEKARESALQEAARATEALMLREARDVVVVDLAKAQIPDVTRARLAEALAKNPPIKEGALDADALHATIKEAIAAEVAYLASVTGSGQVHGMGGSSTGDATEAEVTASLTESFKALGLDDKTAAQAAKGRSI